VSYIALLRGINVGGKNKLPMKELVELFAEAGCSNVRTYIQSGNVVFGASASVRKRLAPTIEQRIKKEYGYSVPIILRSAEELVGIVKANPFLKQKRDPETLHMMFLATEPSASKIATLDPKRSPTDQYRVVGQDVYLYCPHGMGKTKLSNAWFDSKLGTVSTVRNWRTVLTLLDLARE
jgi:uncharacterized protein (DUF1697 family)